MDEDIDISVTVKKLREAGQDSSKQVRPLVELGEWYLKKANKTSNGADFTKANALYNAALVRSKRVNHEISEDQILRRIVETYRQLLNCFTNDNARISVDEIKNEIDSHIEWLAHERRIFKERVDEIDSCCNRLEDKTGRAYEVSSLI